MRRFSVSLRRVSNTDFFAEAKALLGEAAVL
jgi:hypothetical protein